MGRTNEQMYNFLFDNNVQIFGKNYKSLYRLVEHIEQMSLHIYSGLEQVHYLPFHCPNRMLQDNSCRKVLEKAKYDFI